LLSCFIDIVGLSYCSGVYEQPGSGLYLNSLPGISIESIDKIADSEQITYLGVWADVQSSAVAQFRIDVMTELNKCFKLERGCDYDTLICNNAETLVQAWKYCLGAWLMIFRINSTRLNRFTTIDAKQAAELKDFYQIEYEKALKQAVLLMDTSECCMERAGNPETVTWLP
jgi:hypothetical protein